jgi:hypothetical protein
VGVLGKAAKGMHYTLDNQATDHIASMGMRGWGWMDRSL